MARIGITVVELAALLNQHLGHPVPHHDAAQRDVAAGHRLGKSHQIGAVTKLLKGEPIPEAAEGADDLVADQQNAVFVNDALDLMPIGRRRDDDSAGPLHRLGDERRHLLRPQREDSLLQPAGGTQAELVAAFARTPQLKMVGLLDMGDVGNRQVTLGMHAAHAAQRRTGHGAAVVGVVAADDDLALRLAEQVPVAPHHAHVRVVAFAAAGRIENMLEAAPAHLRRQAGEARRQRHCGHIGGLEKAVVKRQRHHLLVRSVGQLPAAVSDIDTPQPTHGIEQAVALGVPDIDIVSLRDDTRTAGREVFEVGEGMQEVLVVELLYSARVYYGVHGVVGAHGGLVGGVRRAATGARVPTARSPS